MFVGLKADSIVINLKQRISGKGISLSETFKIGISSCLLGEIVRWNGGHKKDVYLVKTLGQFVTYLPVCPEVECGLGIPRETLRLVGDPEYPKLVTTRTKVDHTEKMKNWAATRIKALEKEDLCGFIFKKDSPSSGLLRVKVYEITQHTMWGFHFLCLSDYIFTQNSISRAD